MVISVKEEMGRGYIEASEGGEDLVIGIGG